MVKTFEEILREISSKPVNIGIQQGHDEVRITFEIIGESLIDIDVKGNECIVAQTQDL